MSEVSDQNQHIETIKDQRIPEFGSPGVTNSMRLLILTAALGTLAGCDQVKSLVGNNDQQGQPAQTAKPSKLAEQPKPTRPDFLYQDEINLHGLSFLVANSDKVDRFIFNAITGNRQFINEMEVQKGDPLEFSDRTFVPPYHAFVFKAFHPQANLQLPERLGKSKTGGTLVDLINTVTTYKVKDDIEIKTIIATSYEFAFGIKIDPNHIQVVGGKNGRVAAIRYIGPTPEKLIGTVTLATSTEPDPEDKESRYITAKKEKTWRLIDDQGNLYFPVSAVDTHGVLIPQNALKKVKEISYSKTFTSQGITITVPIRIPVDSIWEEDLALQKKKEPKSFMWDNATGDMITQEQVNAQLAAGHPMEVTDMNNLSWYITSDDAVVKKIAHTVTDPFPTAAEKAQAILDFLHSFPYVPDSSKMWPRAPRVALVSRGGDCKGSTILAVSLARAIGIDCAFLYMEHHVAPACDVGGTGTAFANWDGKNWEWMETTGGLTTRTTYVDQFNRPTGQPPLITNRAWQVGEKPQTSPELQYTQRIGGPLIDLRRTQHR